MSLPYENATSGDKALAEIQKVLQRFGCSRFGVMQDWAGAKLAIQFEWRDRQIHIEASSRGYAEAYLREHPWSSRMKRTKREHEEHAMHQASISVYSCLRDWIRGQLTAVETGLLSFEAAFLSHMLLPDGRPVIDHVHDKLLPAPDDE